MSAWLVPIEALVRRRGGDDTRAVGGKAAPARMARPSRFCSARSVDPPTMPSPRRCGRCRRGVTRRSCCAPRAAGRGSRVRPKRARSCFARHFPKGCSRSSASSGRGWSRSARGAPPSLERDVRGRAPWCRWRVWPNPASGFAARRGSPTPFGSSGRQSLRPCARLPRGSRRAGRGHGGRPATDGGGGVGGVMFTQSPGARGKKIGSSTSA